MSELNWVKARHECHFDRIFSQLETGAKSDVATANDLALAVGTKTKFEVYAPSETLFSVTRTGPAEGTAKVEFMFRQSYISITPIQGDEIRVTPTLNQRGECLLLLDGQELELWQVRRLALESLFFGPPSRT